MSVAASPGQTARRGRARLHAPRLRPPRRRPPRASRERARAIDRLVDAFLHGLCALAALVAVAVIAAIAYEVFSGASPSFSHFGLGFLVHTEWVPNFERFGAGVLIYGTLVSSAMALLLAIPLGVAIALYLSTVASGRVRRVIGPLVEMLAGIPSVILGFWGIIVLAPFLQTRLEPFLHSAFGFLPIFGVAPSTGTGLFNAGLLLTMMVIPIIASISRDLFLTVPQELRDGAIALGATRWEVVRGVILPSAGPGIVAASFLGLGRALGEAIAVAQVTGDGNAIKASLFATGATAASRIAQEFVGAENKLTTASLFYLGAILLVIALVLNLAARLIVRRFNAHGALALSGVTLQIQRNLITAFIGPSGCGKTTLLRSLNRMNDSVASFELDGKVLYHGHDLYDPKVDPVEVRRRIGMVFQRPNPFAKSIYDNIAWAPRNLKMKASLDERVERALRGAALWDEVKDRLNKSALGLSGGQQQRLCIARAIAIEPDVLLLDEPASALDPIATAAIEELMHTLKHRYTIVIVTHNMQQAARIADRTAFFSVGTTRHGRTGVLVEYDDTELIFTRPKDPRTGDYVTGRFG